MLVTTSRKLVDFIYKVGMLCSYDFTIQDGLPKLYEFNTNISLGYFSNN